MSVGSQKVILWWGIALAAIYGAALLFLLHMVPPPDATKSSQEVAQFYSEHHDSIRVGATIASWTSAFMVPLFAVIVIQMHRQERGRPIWTVLTAMGGAMMSIFLVLPPLFWGVAAYTENRVDPEVTTLMHELGCLTLTTTDQYYIFAWVAIVVVSLAPSSATNLPFPRWYGYFTAWTAFMFEAGAFAFLPRTGPFAWDGLLVFWSPLSLFGAWIGVTCYCLLKALNRQKEEEVREPAGGPAAAAAPA
jgi:hypothetical protein